MSNKRKRVVLAIEKKLEIIKKFDNGASVKNLVIQYGVGDQTVRDILKNKTKILEFSATSDSVSGMSKRKTMKTATYDELDKAMVLWFNQQRAQGIPVSGVVCAAKALQFFKELNLSGDFNASSGWLTRFKQRHGIRQISVQGEKLSSDENAADQFKEDFRKFIEESGFSPEQIYNADETGLYWKLLPTKTLASESEKSAAGYKIPKQRLTVLCCGNAAGTHFLKPCVIGTAKKPRAFSKINVDNLPVDYFNNKSAWMDREIFTDWFKKKFIPQVCAHLTANNLPSKAVLILDNAPSHPSETILKSNDNQIFVKYLPPNVTALIQPMDQGVIQNMKTIYKRNLLLKLVNERGADLLSFWKELNVLDAIYEIATACKSVKSSTLRLSWRKLLGSEEPENNPQDELIPEMLSNLRKIDSSADETVVREWISADEHLTGHEVLSDQEIIERATQIESTSSADKSDDEDDETLISPQKISHSDALNYTEQLLSYLEQQEDGTLPEKMMLRNLRATIRRKVNESRKQTSILSFLTK